MGLSLCHRTNHNYDISITDLVSPGLDMDEVEVGVLEDTESAGEAGHPTVQGDYHGSL